MNVRANEGGGNREPIPAGTYAARAAIVAGIGEQETTFGPKPKVIICWEIPSIQIEWEDEDGNKLTGPARTSGFYNLTLGSETHPSNLRKMLEGWRGRPFTKEEEAGFDLKNVAGAPCILMIQHRQKKDGNMTDAVVAVSRANDSEVPPLKEPALFYDAWNHESFEQEYARLPEWIQKFVKIPGGSTATAVVADETPHGVDQDEDDIPF